MMLKVVVNYVGTCKAWCGDKKLNTERIPSAVYHVRPTAVSCLCPQLYCVCLITIWQFIIPLDTVVALLIDEQ